MKLRIAVVADTLCGWVGGGVVSGRRFVEQLRRNHDVVVIGADVPGPDCVRLPGFRLPVRAMHAMQFTMARPDRAILRDAFSGVDLVHLQFPFWLSHVALEEARRAGLPVVASFHVQPENALWNVGVRSRRLNAMLYRFWVDRLYNRADAVVCPSHFAERKLRDHGLVAPTVVVSNGVPPDLRRGLRPYAAGAPDPVIVLSVGRLAAEKRPDVIVKAVLGSRHRHRIKLVFAGAGPLEAELRRSVRELPIPAHVGYVERERLEELYGDATLFVHAGEVELEGMAVIEAMAMGVPVVVAQSPESAASLLALDRRFAFPGGDSAALTERLDALLDEPELLREASVRYVAACRRLDLGLSLATLAELYASLVERSLRFRPA